MFITKYQDISDVGVGEKRRTNIVRHEIDTGAERLIRQLARKLPLAKREEADEIRRWKKTE